MLVRAIGLSVSILFAMPCLTASGQEFDIVLTRGQSSKEDLQAVLGTPTLTKHFPSYTAPYWKGDKAAPTDLLIWRFSKPSPQCTLKITIDNIEPHKFPCKGEASFFFRQEKFFSVVLDD
jgi:hypothetical protein